MVTPILVSIVDDHQVLHWVTVLVPIFVSGAVAYFVYQQARTAKEKLRLDLYNRRLAIYERVVTFYRHNILSVKWTNFTNEDRDKLITDLTLATREARFLFKESDGILALFEEFTDSVMSTDREDHLEIILQSIEDKMAPYLNFHSITASPSSRCLEWIKKILSRR